MKDDIRIEGWIEKEIDSGTVLCIDPEHAITDYFHDTQSGIHEPFIELELCEVYAEELNLRCRTLQEIEAWLETEQIHMQYYSNNFDVDFSAHDDYLHESFYALG